ncbi:MAG: sulfur carrier protein ThiS adenylyltransferase ThiF [Thermodesulfobacteriota bacterium]
MITVNERPVAAGVGRTIGQLARDIKADANIFIVNGYPVGPDTVVKEGDACWLIRRGEVPDPCEMNHLLYARHTPGVQERIRTASVGIMGLGGLGSVVAVALARIGVGRLILADYDVVEPSNLNRQQYFIDQVGMAKTEALRSNLARINPYIAVETRNVELDGDLIVATFSGVDALAECFDSARMKAVALRTVLTRMAGTAYVGASGLAGFGDNNSIRTTRLYPRVYLVGDGESAAAPGMGLMAPRVGIAAQHQANQILRLLLGREEDQHG